MVSLSFSLGTPLLEVNNKLTVAMSGSRYDANNSKHLVQLSCGSISPEWVDTLDVVWIVS